MSGKLSDRALNRALLARQGLLEPLDAPLVDVVESIGALQGQQWSALPVALAARMAAFGPDDLYGALERGELLWGIGMRGTLHLVSAREHPEYSVVAHGTDRWARTDGGTTDGMRDLRAALLDHAADEPRTNEQLREFAEAWVAEHPDAIAADELAAQRALKWRPIYRWSRLIRVPADGRWTAKAPADHRAAPGPKRRPGRDRALDAVVRRHLRAFGPAASEDVAGWIGWPAAPVRDAMAAADDLERLEHEDGRTLYDVPGAPRPGPDVDAPARYLAAFDSTQLAYAPKDRRRLVPDALRDLIYEKGNLRIHPTFLVDGLVAGTWSVEVRRRVATLTLRPAGRLTKAARAGLVAEGERLLRATQPGAAEQQVIVA